MSFQSCSAPGRRVAELTSEVIRQGIFLRFFRAVFDRRFPQLNLIEQTD